MVVVLKKCDTHIPQGQWFNQCQFILIKIPRTIFKRISSELTHGRTTEEGNSSYLLPLSHRETLMHSSHTCYACLHQTQQMWSVVIYWAGLVNRWTRLPGQQEITWGQYDFQFHFVRRQRENEQIPWHFLDIYSSMCDHVHFQWRHNERDGVSNHRRLDCLLNRLAWRRSKKTSRLRVTSLCYGNSPMTCEFPAQRASNAGNVYWRHVAS